MDELDEEFENTFLRVRVEMEGVLIPTEPEHFVSDFVLTLLNDSEDEEVIPVGYMKAHRLRLDEALDNDMSTFDVFDAHSDEVASYIDVLLDEETLEIKDSVVSQFDLFSTADIFLVDIVTLAPSVRGKKLGWFLMDKAIKLLGSGCELVVCKPHPLMTNNARDLMFPKDWLVPTSVLDQAKLQRYWEGAGFQRIGRSLVYGKNSTLLQLGNSAVSIEDARSVLRLPDSRLLARTINGWEIYEITADSGFQLLIEESSLEAAVSRAGFVSKGLKKQNRKYSKGDVAHLASLLLKLPLGLSLIWVGTKKEWQVWRKPSGRGKEVDVAGTGATPMDAIERALSIESP